jgi:hypothetical protein
MMVPVAQKDTGLAVVTLFNEPVYEICTILVVLFAVVFVAKVYICKTRRFVKKCHGFPFIEVIASTKLA